MARGGKREITDQGVLHSDSWTVGLNQKPAASASTLKGEPRRRPLPLARCYDLCSLQLVHCAERKEVLELVAAFY